MRWIKSCAVGLTLLFAVGSLQGCGGTKAKTPAQVLKADEVTQNEMRRHYGNMIGKKAQPRRKARHGSQD